MGVIFKNDILFSGGSGDNSRELTYQEYMTLSEEEKKNGMTYYVPDAKSTNISVILNTKEEIEANTEENKIAGALAVKEILKNEIDLGIILTDNTDYTCPFDGYFSIYISNANTGCVMGYVGNMPLLSLNSTKEHTNAAQTASVFVRKGMAIRYLRISGTVAGFFYPIK